MAVLGEGVTVVWGPLLYYYYFWQKRVFVCRDQLALSLRWWNTHSWAHMACMHGRLIRERASTRFSSAVVLKKIITGMAITSF